MTIDEQRARRLEWEGCLNARDLGGYPTASGQETLWGAIIRSDTLSELTEVGRAALIDHGVRSIVDLRMPSEITQHPNPFSEPGSHGIAYTNVSFLDPADPFRDVERLPDEYKLMLDRYAPAVGAVMTAIAEAPEGGVLVHCMGGKDRTGLVSAILLDLVGVPREMIGADYALTAEYLRSRDEEWLENGPGERAHREKEIEKWTPRAEVMLEVLDHVDRRYGGTEGYLQEAGVSVEDIARLRQKLLPSAAQS